MSLRTTAFIGMFALLGCASEDDDAIVPTHAAAGAAGVNAGGATSGSGIAAAGTNGDSSEQTVGGQTANPFSSAGGSTSSEPKEAAVGGAFGNPSLQSTTEAGDLGLVPAVPAVATVASRPTLTFSWKATDFHEADGGCPEEKECGYRLYARRSLDTTYNFVTVAKDTVSVSVYYSLIETSYWISAFNHFGDSGLVYIATLK